ncbi:adoMet-dependent rRNA methyltransferase spb1-like [Humulus lupulus]|uniref:adoMet-dependent rRNA methyltransferase spb1-like n=1 Tax=Humulus lupulus TaxID=3486 RepID=UPI002B40C73D|nr:adoMet-dependent rRNA methyltransferase spb1-like [Humulus lupulus]
MHSLVYIMFNKRLKDRHLKLKSLSKKDDGLVIDEEMPSDDEWVVDEDGNFEDIQRPNDEDLGVDRGTGSSSRGVKRKRVVDLDEDEWEDIGGDNEEGGGDERNIQYDDSSSDDELELNDDF